MKPTIRDVAKLANVSVSTVSRVINNKGYVHEETKKAIINAIKTLEFKPNQLARSLTNKTSKMIGVIVPHIGPFFYGELLESIESTAALSGYKTVFCYTKDDSELELQYLNFFEQYNIGGLVIASNFSNIEELKNLSIPIVSVDHKLELENIPSISSNNYQGGEIVAKHFIKEGAKNILLLRGPSFLLTTIDRTNGFFDHIKGHDINVYTHDIDLINPSYDEILEVIKQYDNLDAIFCFSDILALVTLKALNSLNINVPQDISLIGYDNSPFTKWLSPSLTTVEQPIRQMGAKAFNSLLELINITNDPKKEDVIDVKLIKRHSTKIV